MCVKLATIKIKSKSNSAAAGIGYKVNQEYHTDKCRHWRCMKSDFNQIKASFILLVSSTNDCKKERSTFQLSTNSSGQAVYLHSKDNGHILDTEERWFQRGVKEAICSRVEKKYLNRGGGLRHHLSPIYNAVFSSLPKRLNIHSHLASWDNPNHGCSDLASGDFNNHDDCCYNSKECQWTKWYPSPW